jgi:CheY-like chemotaxis protein
MSSETAARAFEPFFTTKFAGRGLGLPWAMGVAHGHGGAIAIESAPGAGTRVVVFLPHAPTDRDGTSSPPSVGRADEGNVVLVVDDNESVVALAARILDREGYEVLSATDGTTALELFAQHGASLAAVVLDVTMPGMSGDQLFLELVEHGLRAPVIVSSGFAEEEAMRKFDQKAVAGFLQKPYRAQELVDLLRKAVGARSW